MSDVCDVRLPLCLTLTSYLEWRFWHECGFVTFCYLLFFSPLIFSRMLRRRVLRLAMSVDPSSVVRRSVRPSVGNTLLFSAFLCVLFFFALPLLPKCFVMYRPGRRVCFTPWSVGLLVCRSVLFFSFFFFFFYCVRRRYIRRYRCLYMLDNPILS